MIRTRRSDHTDRTDRTVSGPAPIRGTRRRPGRRTSALAAALVAALVLGVVAAGCSGSGGGDDVTSGSASSTTAAASSTSAGSSSSQSTTTTEAASSTTAASTTAAPTTAPPSTAGPSTVPDGGTLLAFFLSPTHNIGCSIYAEGQGGEARCDIRSATFAPPAKPSGCDLDWGDSVVVSSGPGEFSCHGDTAFDPGAPDLGYGQHMQIGSFRCDSERTGVTCTNTQTGHGFSIRRGDYRLF